jgi:hypothetical protein
MFCKSHFSANWKDERFPVFIAPSDMLQPVSRHLARQIREDPLDLDSSLAFKELKKEHEKSHMCKAHRFMRNFNMESSTEIDDFFSLF